MKFLFLTLVWFYANSSFAIVTIAKCNYSAFTENNTKITMQGTTGACKVDVLCSHMVNCENNLSTFRRQIVCRGDANGECTKSAQACGQESDKLEMTGKPIGEEKKSKGRK